MTTKPNEPEAQKLRDLIAEIAADLSTENPFWTAKLLADALITRGIGIVPAHPVADAGGVTADIDHLDALLDCSGDCDKMLALIAQFRLQSVAAATAAKDAAFLEAAQLVFCIEAAGAIEFEGENFTRWKERARSIAPSLRAALSEAREAGDSLSAEDRV
ncbi:hypothetical protein [Sphingobium sp.]|jgi:hypothetical protein|uniref:hypothetical protein n=1 Tax=Sphingobium sp. TaxID=1912891 RepID=UPI000DB3D215|nr:hypothetical protein [Sphingobium sp.]PZU65263.1 MAG: hypothetical protein DI540_18020 [Sphingobium sp.]